MLTFTLRVKPLTVNRAWRGRRFSTSEKTAYEATMRLVLPKVAVVGMPFYAVAYDFHLVNFALTDWDNLVKVTQDCIVKRGIISDDRLIVDARVRKFKAAADRIVVRVAPCASVEP